jgi:biotin synthase-related radical SAM superfamily protein
MHALERVSEYLAQAVHLVDEVEDHADAGVVDLEIALEVADQLGAHEVGLGERRRRSERALSFVHLDVGEVVHAQRLRSLR